MPPSPPTPRRRYRLDSSLKSRREVTHRRCAVVGSGDMSFRWVIETVTGTEGREVRAAQARAMRELATWLSDSESRQAKERTG